MTHRSRMLLFWLPRALCVAFALFLSIFALDVFSEPLPFWRMLLALAMHLVPSFIVLGLLLVSWKREWLGAFAYILFGVAYIVAFGRNFPWTVSVSIGGPLCLIGVLFLANWMKRDELRAA